MKELERLEYLLGFQLIPLAEDYGIDTEVVSYSVPLCSWLNWFGCLCWSEQWLCEMRSITGYI